MGNYVESQPEEPATNKKTEENVIQQQIIEESKIKEYFHTDFPIVISPQVFKIRYEYIICLKTHHYQHIVY